MINIGNNIIKNSSINVNINCRRNNIAGMTAYKKQENKIN